MKKQRDYRMVNTRTMRAVIAIVSVSIIILIVGVLIATCCCVGSAIEVTYSMLIGISSGLVSGILVYLATNMYIRHQKRKYVDNLCLYDIYVRMEGMYSDFANKMIGTSFRKWGDTNLEEVKKSIDKSVDEGVDISALYDNYKEDMETICQNVLDSKIDVLTEQEETLLSRIYGNVGFASGVWFADEKTFKNWLKCMCQVEIDVDELVKIAAQFMNNNHKQK